jgi:replicative DNA helicase
MKKEEETFDYSRLVFTPNEASNATEKYIEEIRANDGDGMPLYISKLDYTPADHKGFLPVKRGELITVLGRPGNGKTGFMLHWARKRAQDLKRRAALGEKTGIVLYFTLEQLVEELRLFHVAGEEHISATDMANGRMQDEQWQQVTNSLRGLTTMPLWFAGKSLRRRKDKIKISRGTFPTKKYMHIAPDFLSDILPKTRNFKLVGNVVLFEIENYKHLIALYTPDKE